MFPQQRERPIEALVTFLTRVKKVSCRAAAAPASPRTYVTHMQSLLTNGGRHQRRESVAALFLLVTLGAFECSMWPDNCCHGVSYLRLRWESIMAAAIKGTFDHWGHLFTVKPDAL